MGFISISLPPPFRVYATIYMIARGLAWHDNSLFPPLRACIIVYVIRNVMHRVLNVDHTLHINTLNVTRALWIEFSFFFLFSSFFPIISYTVLIVFTRIASVVWTNDLKYDSNTCRLNIWVTEMTQSFSFLILPVFRVINEFNTLELLAFIVPTRQKVLIFWLEFSKHHTWLIIFNLTPFPITNSNLYWRVWYLKKI